MQTGQPSRTAFAAAGHRAAHQVLEHGSIFTDPLALCILGPDADAVVQAAQDNPSSRRMRLFIAARTHFAETSLARAVSDGASQLVVLGAGLDTFAYRNPFPAQLRVFEVDHPATQAWKRNRLAEAGISLPSSLTFAPVDFERESLADGLAAAGFDPAQPTFFTWLGVVPYLSDEAIWATLNFIASLPARAWVVFDYSDPPETLEAATKEWHDTRAARVREIGEAWVSYFEAEPLRTRLIESGFQHVEDLGPVQMSERYFPRRTSEAKARGGHFLLASKRPPAESRWVGLRLKVAGLRLKPPEGFPAESRLKARWAR
jgi:methyltransferase (TIGR00027 family)